jgi:hypothetical protein
MLSNITLYFLTRTFATSMYPYWTSPVGRVPHEVQVDSASLKETKKPVGYSFFTKEIHPIPIKWVDQEVGGLAWSRRHEQVCVLHHGGRVVTSEDERLYTEADPAGRPLCCARAARGFLG